MTDSQAAQSKRKFTPGPWTVGKPYQPMGRNDNNPVTPILAHDTPCDKCGRHDGKWLVAWTFRGATPHGTWKHNAHLIASAPELLNEAERAVEILEHLLNLGYDPIPITRGLRERIKDQVATSRRAISQALGESE